jgi:hypothetical protein
MWRDAPRGFEPDVTGRVEVAGQDEMVVRVRR